MTKKCIYCGSEVSDDSVIDFCKRCGIGVWGERMFNAILQNMETARENDDLCCTNLDPKKIYWFLNQLKDKFFKGEFSSLHMAMKKKVQEKGKLKLSRYFQKLKEGDSVAVVIEPSLKLNFPERLQGRSGKVKSQKGRSYVVSIKDQTKEKDFIIAPIHLKKLKQIIN